ncbi:hypothetical protein BY458DRAFT_487893 [Sporodiniella umbellata]|nr:hypothetical protein BY458DRAFT_487893 [Sporodiniella umbellata]
MCLIRTSLLFSIPFEESAFTYVNLPLLTQPLIGKPGKFIPVKSGKNTFKRFKSTTTRQSSIFTFNDMTAIDVDPIRNKHGCTLQKIAPDNSIPFDLYRYTKVEHNYPPKVKTRLLSPPLKVKPEDGVEKLYLAITSIFTFNDMTAIDVDPIRNKHGCTLQKIAPDNSIPFDLYRYTKVEHNYPPKVKTRLLSPPLKVKPEDGVEKLYLAITSIFTFNDMTAIDVDPIRNKHGCTLQKIAPDSIEGRILIEIECSVE